MHLSGAAPEPTFDRLTDLVRLALHTPISLISRVREERQIFLGQSGLPQPWASTREVALSYSFCRHVVASGEPLIVEDAREHPLGSLQPSGWPAGVIAYAGLPLRMGGGQVRGTFCVLDTRPRKWTEEVIRYLSELAAVVEIQWQMDPEEKSMDGTRDPASVVR